jgi:hypothetical protein
MAGAAGCPAGRSAPPTGSSPPTRTGALFTRAAHLDPLPVRAILAAPLAGSAAAATPSGTTATQSTGTLAMASRWQFVGWFPDPIGCVTAGFATFRAGHEHPLGRLGVGQTPQIPSPPRFPILTPQHDRLTAALMRHGAYGVWCRWAHQRWFWPFQQSHCWTLAPS